MKRMIRTICILVAIALILPTAAFAEESSTLSSAYFTEIQAFLSKKSNLGFEIWFDVTATRGMDVLGVFEIRLQRSSNNANWTTVKTYTPEDYPQLQETNTGSVTNCVSYAAIWPGYYRAEVTFYAERAGGTGMVSMFTSSLQMP